MSIYDDLPPKSSPMSHVWRGRVATAPTTLKERISVYLPDFSGTLLWKGCRWQPRVFPILDDDREIDVAGGPGSITLHEETGYWLFPKKGDLCLCVFDNYKEIWVVMFWPY